MDRIYIIKIGVYSILDIKTPIATWLLARLYNEQNPITRKDLLRNLCNASFDSMTNENQFGDTMRQLIENKYIEHTTQEYSDFLPITDNPDMTLEEQTTRLQEIKRKRDGFVITESGIYAFRKQIGTPLELCQQNLDKIPLTATMGRFRKILETLRTEHDTIDSAVKLCVENAQLVLDFIKGAATVLAPHGIRFV